MVKDYAESAHRHKYFRHSTKALPAAPACRRANAEIPVVPKIKAHSIVDIQGEADYRKGRDGLAA